MNRKRYGLLLSPAVYAENHTVIASMFNRWKIKETKFQKFDTKCDEIALNDI